MYIQIQRQTLHEDPTRNPRRACAARVTVVTLGVCLSAGPGMKSTKEQNPRRIPRTTPIIHRADIGHA